MGQFGVMEITLIILVLVLLFGAKKLPELARGSGRALRIFKAETKGLLDDDDDDKAKTKTEEQRQIDSQRVDVDGEHFGQDPQQPPVQQSPVQPTPRTDTDR